MYSRSQKKSDKRHLFTTLWLIRYSNDASAASNESGQIFDLSFGFLNSRGETVSKQGWNDKNSQLFCTFVQL